ncbi:ATP-binding protein [Pseudomonas yamanorum]|uniref:phosphoribosyltransferase-like protein n=1 Tax=Pseudomonas yamanorum TaxID=515393 RepID=UPI0015A22CC1|nr:ATP-binding protein [Pseudomonas yamanorum]NWD21701.1 ATP-binding protein [Pseudomonas yamanorum]
MAQENQTEVLFLKLNETPNNENLNILFKSICIRLELNSTTPQTSLLDPSNNNSTKKIVASYLIRILDLHSTLLWEDSNLRLKIINLFNELYSNQIYRIKGLDSKSKSNSHEIFAALQPIHSDTIAAFTKIKNSIVSIDTAIDVRRNYIKLLSNPLTQIFTANQISDQSLISKERLSEVFNGLEQYKQAERLNISNAFTRLKDIFNTYISDIKTHEHSIYTQELIENILIAIFITAQTHFDESGLQTPVKLLIKPSERKYPLHIINEYFPVKLELTNAGPGAAFDTKINIVDSDTNLEIDTEEVNLGTVDAGKHEFILKVQSLSPTSTPPSIIGLLSWADYEGERTENEFEITVTPQNGTVNWNKIKYMQPYSLESVDSEDELIGRKDLLENISSKLSLKKGESSIIYGQKRVGKTSLARTIQNRFSEKENHVTIFIETGSLDKSSSHNFIRSLGTKIIRNLRKAFLLENNDHYEINSSLHPLISCVEDIVSRYNKARIIIILDEFDEIPSQLYPYTSEGDSFFHNLRSLSGESGEGRVSLILVGGENMNVIMQSTDKLNKFDAWNVGYFNKSEYWEDFKELLTLPVSGLIEYSDEAILSLYEVTEGNPFYTKFVAKALYKKMCERRCAFISIDEIEDAIRDTILHMEAINLNHFWSDGIRVEDSERRDLIETQRRRFLIAFADKLREDAPIDKNSIIADKSLSTIPCKEILESFTARNIIVEENGFLRIKPKLFENWLVEKGVHTLRASFADEDAQTAFNEKESSAYISDAEIIELTVKWELYKGIQVGPTHVRAWLAQFENNAERRLAFKLIQNLDFYGEARIREKLRIVHDTIKREIVHSIKSGERVRKDILISAFGTISKSGATYVRMYATENSITSHSVKPYSDLRKTILADEQIKAIVFIDDMVASGKTLIESINTLNTDIGDILEKRKILVVVGIICGITQGVENSNKHIDTCNFGFKIELKVCDIIGDHKKAFSSNSEIFEPEEQTKALTMARKYGSKLQSRHPLGFQDSQLLIVFKDNCPNNTLPIIWASANEPKWTPLFKRS